MQKISNYEKLPCDSYIIFNLQSTNKKIKYFYFIVL